MHLGLRSDQASLGQNTVVRQSHRGLSKVWVKCYCDHPRSDLDRLKLCVVKAVRSTHNRRDMSKYKPQKTLKKFVAQVQKHMNDVILAKMLLKFHLLKTVTFKSA